MMKPNSIAPLTSIPSTRRILSALSIVLSLGLALAAFGVQQGTSWTYQGQLRRSGAAYNGTCDLQFSLWDAASAGTQKGTQSINGVNVVNGLFTVVLDFGDLFTGNARWLGTSVQCSGDGGFTPLDPRQPITAAPYALSLRPGASVVDSDGPANGAALQAQSLTANGTGLTGWGNFAGVSGFATSLTAFGIYGSANGANATGVYGENGNGVAIWGKSFGSGPAVYGQATGNGLAGRFTGPVAVEGNLIVQGTLFKSAGSFRIDHPLDPANKFLSHSFVESPDMMNIYNGVATLDAHGQAVVRLPDYFEALNRDFRYQLTCIGGFAPVYVAQEITQNQFRIDGGTPGLKVSWQITGNRKDAYAQAHPIVVEEPKPAEEQGLYLYPAGFGAGEEKGIGHLSRPALKPRPQDPSGAIPNSQPGK
jgi:hypothetical protein